MMYRMSEFTFGCSKALLVVLNVLCILIAVFLFGFAVVDTRVLSHYGEEEAVGTLVSDLIIIGACVLLVAVAVFGCVGLTRNSVKMLYLYIGFLMMLVMVEVIVAIYVALQRFGLEYRIINHLREDFFRNATGSELTQHMQYWDYLQSAYMCCGLNSPEDYKALGKPISVSCCAHAYRVPTTMAQKQLYRSCLDTESYYAEGCEEAVLYVLRDSADCMLGVASLGLWFEVSGMVLAALVANNLKNRVEVYKKTTKY